MRSPYPPPDFERALAARSGRWRALLLTCGVDLDSLERSLATAVTDAYPEERGIAAGPAQLIAAKSGHASAARSPDGLATTFGAVAAAGPAVRPTRDRAAPRAAPV